MIKFHYYQPLMTDEVSAGLDGENVYLRAFRRAGIKDIREPEFDGFQCGVVLDEATAKALADFLLSAIRLIELKQNPPTKSTKVDL